MDKKSGLLYISISVMVVVVIVLGVILTLDREEPNIYVQTEVNQKDIYWNFFFFYFKCFCISYNRSCI